MVDPARPVRTCKPYGGAQPIDRFPRAKSTSPGADHEHRCKACHARRAKERYESDPTHHAYQIAHSMNGAVARRTRGRVTDQVEVLAKLILSTNACTYGVGPLDTFGSAVDHMTPLSRGGQHALENLTVACEPCNRAKGDLLAGELRAWLAGVALRFPPS